MAPRKTRQTPQQDLPDQSLIQEIVSKGVLVMVLALMVYIVYLFVTTLAGQVPANISTGLVLIVGLYWAVTSKKVRDEMTKWGKK